MRHSHSGKHRSSPTGDTIKVAGVAIRLTDYDSPELFSPKCPRERELAWRAKLELEHIIDRVKLELRQLPLDRRTTMAQKPKPRPPKPPPAEEPRPAA
jgi:hypothetical protein